MKKIALLAFTWKKYGGWPTYTRHLKAALESAGIQVDVFSMESPTAARDWAKKITDFACLAKYDLVLVTIAMTGPQTKDAYELILPYLDKTVFVIHDPTEYKKELLTFLNKHRPPVIFIRPTMLTHDKTAWPCLYIPHPYKRTGTGHFAKPKKWFVATSRVDWDKNTAMILQSGARIDICTGHINRIYEYQALREIIDCPLKEWEFYRGGFDTPIEVYPHYRCLVDLSVIKGDGGGTEYTFLEAMDAGLALCLHTNWCSKQGEMIPNRTHTEVNTAKGLRRFCRAFRTDPASFPKDYAHVLKAHDYRRIGKRYVEVLTAWLSDGSGFDEDRDKKGFLY